MRYHLTRDGILSRLPPGLLTAVVVMLAGCSSPPAGDQAVALQSQVSGPADAPGATGYVISRIEDLTVVDCLLPGRLRKMGTMLTWVDRPRAVKKTISDCEILGGQYVLFDRANYDTALAVWQVAADQGDPTAQTYVGEIYERGLGRAPDYAAAAQWYRKAAQQGSARAQFRLGALYEKGLGVPRDSVEALDWYRQAAGLSRDRIVYLSQALAEAKRRYAPAGPVPGRVSTGGGGTPKAPRPDRPKSVPTAATSSTNQARSELTAIQDTAKSRASTLQTAERARDQAKQEIVMRSQQVRLMDQARPVVRADRRLIDQYVALTQEAESQRIAKESLQRVLEVGTPVVAQQ